MKKIDIKKAAGAGVLSLGLVVGVAGFAGASSGTIGTTGPDSDNEISHESDVDMDFHNKNKIDIDNWSHQYASSGEAEARGNTTAGDATSGDAANATSLSATVEVDNSEGSANFSAALGGNGSNSGSINNTGPDSENKVKFDSDVNIDVDNHNYVHVDNDVSQKARSGDAEVKHNTTGGSATSGSVSNTSTSSFTVRVTN